MKIMCEILLLILTLCYGSLCLGQSDLVKENKFASDYANVILQISKEIELEYPKTRLNEIDRQTFENIFNNKIGKFRELYVEAIDIPSAQNQIFKNLIKYLKVTSFYDILINTLKTSKIFFRKKSFGITVAIMMGVACEYLVPIILVNIGLGVIAPLSPFVPWTMTYMQIPNMLEKLKMKKKLISTLGSKSRYIEYMDHLKKMRDVLRLESPEHFLFPIRLTDEGTELVVGSRSSMFRNLLGKLGFFQNSISFESLMRFSVVHNSVDSYIRYVSLMDASRDQKTSLIAQHIIKNGDDELKLAFRKKFSPHLFLIKGAETWTGMYDWTKKAMKITDFNDIFKLIKDMPPAIDVREVFGIYENILLPKYAENFDIGYFEYRKLLQNFELMKAKVLQSGELNFHVENRAEFVKYLDLTLKSVRLSPCKNSHNQVIKFLMRSV
ncbi:MAG: hypothetical protein HN576_05000 [Bacteriovoracaceae bacterium]|jgi:hypothetical protein|nr:hypothetical protein [Bacteriovoracaceae bacterium]